MNSISGRVAFGHSSGLISRLVLVEWRHQPKTSVALIGIVSEFKDIEVTSVIVVFALPRHAIPLARQLYPLGHLHERESHLFGVHVGWDSRSRRTSVLIHLCALNEMKCTALVRTRRRRADRLRFA